MFTGHRFKYFAKVLLAPISLMLNVLRKPRASLGEHEVSAKRCQSAL